MDRRRLPPEPQMGMHGYFPDRARELRNDFETMTPAERVAQAISLSRTATRIAAAARAVR